MESTAPSGMVLLNTISVLVLFAAAIAAAALLVRAAILFVRTWRASAGRAVGPWSQPAPDTSAQFRRAGKSLAWAAVCLPVVFGSYLVFKSTEERYVAAMREVQQSLKDRPPPTFLQLVEDIWENLTR